MNADESFNTQYRRVMELLHEAFRSEVKAQGHYNTGRLDRSFTFDINHLATKVVGTFYAEEYAITLNDGVPAENIPFSPGSGAGKSLYIDGLIEYFRSKGFGDQAKGIAFATAWTHKREGMPTRGSYKYSSSGKRTGFIEDAYDKKEDMIFEMIQYGVDMEAITREIIREFEKQVN